MFQRLFLFALLTLGVLYPDAAKAVVLVKDSQNPIPVIIPADASPATTQAAEELVQYIEKIAGVKPRLITGKPQTLPPAAIWVGVQPGLDTLFPDVKLTFDHPEEILIAANGPHLLIAGKDQFNNQTQVEFGTANAVYTFLQKYLQVRWFWPGELGQDIIPERTIELDPFVYRFHPIFRERRFHYPPAVAYKDETDEWWYLHQRGRYSFPLLESHSFNNWWNLYHTSHPEYFALQPNGTRIPPQNPMLAKLCISNPDVARQWLENATKTLQENPSLDLIGAMPNDGGGWCVCENCKAWDNPKAAPGSLTDRYVKFWNILAREIKKRFPDRHIMISVLAYSRNRLPPVAEKLEDNICVGYVGSFPITNDASRHQQKEDWLKWSAQATKMRYRPNLFWYSGGVWGFPTYEPEKTIEDYHFLAQNACVGIEVDSAFMNWSTLGPQLYLQAQLTYDPLQDGQELLKDYYQRAFGPAGKKVQDYFNLMAQAHQQIVETPGYVSGGSNRYKVLDVITEVYDGKLLSQADRLLEEAKGEVAKSAPIYRQRVEFVAAGLQFVKLQRDALVAMKKVRDTSGMDAQAMAQAVSICQARDAFVKNAPPFAIDYKRVLSQMKLRNTQEYFGPPPQDLQKMATSGQGVQYAPPKWSVAFEDKFDGDKLSDNWQVTNPSDARVENGQLILHANTLLTTKSYPGLHRIEIYVTGLPDAQGKFGDLSPLIQASSADINTGYFLQFGGILNTFNSLRRLGKMMADDRSNTIKADVPYRIIAEFNGSVVRLSINNRTIMKYRDFAPLVGEKHQRLGFYVWTGAKIDRIRILTGPAVPLTSPLNDPDLE